MLVEICFTWLIPGPGLSYMSQGFGAVGGCATYGRDQWCRRRLWGAGFSSPFGRRRRPLPEERLLCLMSWRHFVPAERAGKKGISRHRHRSGNLTNLRFRVDVEADTHWSVVPLKSTVSIWGDGGGWGRPQAPYHREKGSLLLLELRLS